MRAIVALTTLFLIVSAAYSQEPAVADVLKRFEQAKPGEKSLAFYSLDWVCSLPEARQRAQAEKRPLLLILNTNITAHCNFYSGHT